MLTNDSRKILKAFVFQSNHYIFIEAENLCAVKTLQLQQTNVKSELQFQKASSVLHYMIVCGDQSVHAVC